MNRVLIQSRLALLVSLTAQSPQRTARHPQASPPAPALNHSGANANTAPAAPACARQRPSYCHQTSMRKAKTGDNRSQVPTRRARHQPKRVVAITKSRQQGAKESSSDRLDHAFANAKCRCHSIQHHRSAHPHSAPCGRSGRMLASWCARRWGEPTASAQSSRHSSARSRSRERHRKRRRWIAT